MAKSKHRTPEQIIHLLRQAEVELAGGQPLPQVCRKLGVSEQARRSGGPRSSTPGMPSAATASPSAGRAASSANLARPSGGRPTSPTTSRRSSGG
jgi:hypothetical protein